MSAGIFTDGFASRFLNTGKAEAVDATPNNTALGNVVSNEKAFRKDILEEVASSRKAAGKARPIQPRNYNMLASLMGRSRQSAVFRRFNEMTVLNLLRLQAELASLQSKLKTYSQGKVISDFHALKLSQDPQDRTTQELLENLGKKLEEYRVYPLSTASSRHAGLILLDTTLLRAAEVNKLEYAPSQKLKHIQQWQSLPDPENGFLKDVEKLLWDEDEDFITTYDYKGMGDVAPAWFSNVYEFFRRKAKVCLSLIPRINRDLDKDRLTKKPVSRCIRLIIEG